MDWSRISRLEWIGIGCAIVALISLFLMPWYSLTDTPERATQNAWLCGTDDFSCTGWETFPYLRWALLLGVAAPLILAYILARGHKLSWAPGEMTMIAASVGLVLIGYNGIIDTPAPDEGTEFGIGTDWGYWIAVLAGVGMVVTAFLRSQESGGKQARKAPGTV
jgi:hypothetical protein